MGQRVLVTGAGGFLGRELVNRLLQEDGMKIHQLPVSDALKLVLQSKFENDY